MNAKLYAYLTYTDAHAALDWLQKVGFVIVRQQDGPDNTVVHAEVRMGEAVLMAASNDAEYQRAPLVGRSTGQGLYLLVDDVDAFYRTAIAGGASAVIEPEDTEWGSRRARVLDPQGQEWSAGSYEPGATW